MSRNTRLESLCKFEKAESTGWRGAFFYPNGSIYRGCWKLNKMHRYGVLDTKRNYTYAGQWVDDKRSGDGILRKRFDDGTAKRIYIGHWCDDKKCGMGKQFFENGIYNGEFSHNQRHGMGQMKYNNNNEYFGMWAADAYHGLGVYFYSNGNRYEGNFARGFKNGEGTFYHNHTGQIQKGMWDNGICKTSLMVDEFRNQVDYPTEYPIPPCKLLHPDLFIYRMFAKYIANKDKPMRSVLEQLCLNWLHKRREFAHFLPTLNFISNVPQPIKTACLRCSCEKNEKTVLLRCSDEYCDYPKMELT